ncbi:MAG: type II toxin-antitoxin system Phd/YefM family antitoxin [Aggregatilineaceae bacterium]
MSNIWQLQEAKSRFSELIDRALEKGAQVVTRRGKKVVVVLPYEEYGRLITPQDNLAHFCAILPWPDQS